MSKTIIEILYDYNLVGDKTYGLGYRETQELLKELEELLLKSLPNKVNCSVDVSHNLEKDFEWCGSCKEGRVYNYALEDTHIAIKSIIGGK